MKIRKVLSLLLALVFAVSLVSVLPVSAGAAGKLATPQGRWNGTTIEWNAVPNAARYSVILLSDPDDGIHLSSIMMDVLVEPQANGTLDVTLRNGNNPKGSAWDGHDLFSLDVSNLIVVPSDKYYFSVSAFNNASGYETSDAFTSEHVFGSILKAVPHAVTVTNGTADPSEAKAGQTVTITYKASSLIEAGLTTLDHWEVVSGGVTLADASAKTTTFTMPDQDVSIKGVLKKKETQVPFAFITQPKSGTAKKTDSYAYSWATNATPDSIFIDRWIPSANDWGSSSSLAGLTSSSEPFRELFADGNVSKYRIRATKGTETIYSTEFTVTWTEDAPSDATHKVNTGSLTVRQAPDGERIGGLTLDDPVKVVETQGEWSKIEYQGGYGWVMSKYLTALENTVPQTAFAFTKQPQSGTAKKTEDYTYSWALSDTPDTVVLQAWKPIENMWADYISLSGSSNSGTVGLWSGILDGNTSKYRIQATKGSQTIQSNEFTVTWTENTEIQGNTINAVTITGVTTPTAGATPKTTGFKVETPHVTAYNPYWADSISNIGTKPFEAGKNYYFTVYLHPEDGYAFSDSLQVTVNGIAPKSGYSLRYNTTDWLALVEFTAGSEQNNPFVDIKKSDPWYDAVLWAYHAKPQVTNGVDATHFGPEKTVTRGQCAAFLWRAMGEPEPTNTKNPFVDVPSSQYYYKPILWAVEKGITKGTDATHFSPNSTLSTAHIITFLYRAKNPGQDGWWGEAEYWAEKGYGIGNPFGVTTAVNPTTDCPRGYVVMFLQKAK